MTRRPITELSVDAAYRRLQSDRHQRFEAAMNSGAPIVDNAGPLTVIGELEYDGPRCPADDCGEPVDNDGEMCDPCGDAPHPFRRISDARWPNWCACGRIRAASEHDGQDEPPPPGGAECSRCGGDGCDWHLSPTNGAIEIDDACPDCTGTGKALR